MKLLLTGATGFLGRNFLLRVLHEKRYDQIFLPVRSREKLLEQLVADGFAEIPDTVTTLIGSAPDWGFRDLPVMDHVVHSAGVIFARTWEEYEATNVQGTLRLFEQIPRPKKAVILSSLSAAGPSPDDGFKTELDSDNPITWYGRSKLEMEHKVASRFPDLNYLFLRPPMVFGARDHATLPLFKMVKKPVHFKSGWHTKFYSYIDVGDLVSAISAALTSQNDWANLARRYFFVGSTDPITDRELIASSAKVSKTRGLIVSVPQPILRGLSMVVDSIPTWRATIPSLTVDRAKEIWPRRWVVSSKSFCDTFGWRPEKDLLTTLKETRDWYVKTGQLAS